MKCADNSHVIFTATGYDIEKFINIALMSNVHFHALHRKSPSELRATVSYHDFFHLRKAAKATRTHIRINARKGPIFLWFFIKRRCAFAFGFLLCAFIIYMMLSRIWIISVDGEGVDTAAIRASVLEYVQVGMDRGELDLTHIKESILAKHQEVSWVGADIQGVRLQIHVVPALVKPDDMISPHTPCHIVATEAGQVTEIETLAGTPAVAPGDTVIKGQILIYGYESRGENHVPVHAAGRVLANIWAMGEGITSTNTMIKKTTGEFSQSRTLFIGESSYALESLDSYENYIDEEKDLPLLGLFYPVSYRCIMRYETLVEILPRDRNEVQIEACSLALINAIDNMPWGAIIIDKREDYSIIEDGKMRCLVTLTYNQDIAKTQFFSP